MTRPGLAELVAPALALLALAAGCAGPASAVQGEGAAAKADAGAAWDALDRRGKLAVEAPVAGGTERFLLRGGTVMTAAGAVHAPGWVLVDGGRIEAVGGGAPPGPERLRGARVVDVTGGWVTPGLIDTHSHLGVYPAPSARAHGDGNEATAPTTPGVWAEHSVWPQDPGFERALAGGVTTLQVLPGSANLVGGRGVTLHLVPHRGSRAMRFPGAPDALKMACGENPKRVYGDRKAAPSTRMGNLRGQRQAFLKALEHRDELAAGKAKRDLDAETLVGLIEGRVLAHVHCYRADDMLSFLELADEMGFRVRSFHHAVEAYKIRDVLAAKGVSVSTWADWWGFKLEAFDAVVEALPMLAAAGARAIVHSDSARGIQRLNQEAAKALAAGRRVGLALSDDEALRWLTANPAWALGIDDQVGTLEAGKRADVVVWDGSPFSVYSSPRLVFVDGALRWDKDRPGEPWSDFELGQEVGR